MNDCDDNLRKRMLDALTLGLAIVCFAVCLTDWFQVSGGRYGMFYGVFVDPPPSGFSADGPNYFQSVNSWYFFISICLLLFLAGKLFGRSFPAVIVRIFTLCVAVFPFLNMLTYKYDVMTVELHYEWLEISIYLDWACLIAMTGIMFIETISLISRNRIFKKLLPE